MAEEKTAKEAEKKEVKPTKFYARGVGKHTEYIPKRDEKGKILYRQDKYGRDILNKNGDRVPIIKKIVFNTVIGNPTMGTYCEYETTDEFEIKDIKDSVKDGSSPVCTEAEFEKGKNAAAFEMKQKFEEEQKKRKEADEALERAKALNARYEAENAELKEKLKTKAPK